MKKLSSTLAFVLTVGALCGARPAAAQAPVGDVISVSGTVIDETTGLPLAGVAVRHAEGRVGTITDAEGYYRLRNIPNRNGMIRAYRIGYIPEDRAVWVCAPADDASSCTPSAATNQVVRFYMRPVPKK